MKLTTLVLLASMLSPSTANAEDFASLQQRVDRLENRITELSHRLDGLGASSAMREVRTVDPVFMGEGNAKPSPLAMDDPTINCPAHSFVTAIQLLKTEHVRLVFDLQYVRFARSIRYSWAREMQSRASWRWTIPRSIVPRIPP